MKGILGIPSVNVRTHDVNQIFYDSYLPEVDYYELINTGKYGSGFIIYYDIWIRVLLHNRNSFQVKMV